MPPQGTLKGIETEVASSVRDFLRYRGISGLSERQRRLQVRAHVAGSAVQVGPGLPRASALPLPHTPSAAGD